MKKTLFLLAAVLCLSFIKSAEVQAYVIPQQDTNARAFYVFGPDGNPLVGAEDSVMEIFIEVPADEISSLTIEVYDPDTGNFFDWREPVYEIDFKPALNEWNTTCIFELYGETLLDSAEFDLSPEWDRKWYLFGPYDKTEGEKVGDYYRFRLVATGISGDDQNLFRVRISPESAESYAEKVKIRLHQDEGKEMFFYPRIPSGTKNIVVENYDLDPKGGVSRLASGPLRRGYDVATSESGEWTQTVIPVSPDFEGTMLYVIKKGTQPYANAVVKMQTDKGEQIPIYFRKTAPRVMSRAKECKRPDCRPAPAVKPVVTPAPKPEPKLVIDRKSQCNIFTFDATSSYDIDKQKLSFFWDFGDGTTSTEPIVTHAYEKGGEYTVTLTVTNDSGLDCDTSTTSQKVFANTPPIAAFSAPDIACLSDTIYFDASDTTDDDPRNLTFTWDFGDGTKAQGERASHSYAKGGVYTVRLVADDNSGTACNLDSIQKTIRVNTPPAANAGGNINLCLKSLGEEYIVALDGSKSRGSDGKALNYSWNMGDGTVLSGEKIRHTYKNSGTYKVTLTVNDGMGLICSSSSDNITVSLNKPPIANAGGDKRICSGQTVTFDGSASKTEPGEKLSYKWNFGDGNEAAGVTAAHTYQKGGKYPVTLTVNDNMNTSCSTAMDVSFVHINAKPSAELAQISSSCIGKTVGFDASGSKDPDGDVLSYHWDFGDGRAEKGTSKMVHTYQKGGSYNVTVTVDDGSDSACSSDYISRRININTPPVAKIDMAELCCIDMEQKFDGSKSSDADGDTLSYNWDFGDGTKAQGAKVSHVYTKPGTYRVILEINDGSGTECSSSVTSQNIKVSGNPVSVIKVR